MDKTITGYLKETITGNVSVETIEGKKHQVITGEVQ